MQQLSEAGHRVVSDVAQRHGFSNEAVTVMLQAVAAGYGNQAQFNHHEFGGMGQWSAGGMLMIGDMFNDDLKGRVSNLCQELSSLVQGQDLFHVPAQTQSQSQGSGWHGQQGQSHGGFGANQMQGGRQQMQGGGTGASLFVPGTGQADWWPADLGQAGSVGAQNNLRYAYFPNARRLAIDVNGHITVYDTGDHQIGGFSQQQSGDQSLSFNSQFGLVRVADLPIITGENQRAGYFDPAQTGPVDQSPPAPLQQQAPQNMNAPDANARAAPAQQSQESPAPQMQPNEIFELIEKLADLQSRGILTDTEFETKKAELLSRL